VVRFEPKENGGVTVGQPSRQILPGVDPPQQPKQVQGPEPATIPTQDMSMKALPPTLNNPSIQQVSYNAAAATNVGQGNSAAPAQYQPQLASQLALPMAPQSQTTSSQLQPQTRRMAIKTIGVPPDMQSSLTSPSGMTMPNSNAALRATEQPQYAQPPAYNANGNAPTVQSSAALGQTTATAPAATTPTGLAPTGAAPAGLAPTGTTPATTSPAIPYASTFPQRSRSVLSQFRAANESSVLPVRDRVPSLQSPAGSPSVPGFPQGSGLGNGLPASAPGAPTGTY
jgi:hypothetical protein